jgi:hypothetical protein
VSEREWFQQTVAGRPPARGEGPEDPDTSWDVDDHELDEVVFHPQIGEVSVRWVVVHMIEETARHAGRADILRELTDGSIGVV